MVEQIGIERYDYPSRYIEAIERRDTIIMEENKTSTWEEYRKRTHVIGRIASAVTLVMLVGAPFLIGKFLGAYPDLKAVARAFFIRRAGMAGEQCGRVSDLYTDAGFRWRIPCIYYRKLN